MINDEQKKNFLAQSAKGQPDPIKSDKNFALSANVLVSTTLKSARPMTEISEYFGVGAVDGIVNLNAESKNKSNEWISDGEKKGAFFAFIMDKATRCL